MTKSKSVKIDGKDVPLTKKGLPNKVYLSKEAKAIVKQFEDKMKGEKKEILERELGDLFKDLMK